MSKHPDLNGTALALLRALDRGEVRRRLEIARTQLG